MLKIISAFILRIIGWKIEGSFPHSEKKLVIIVFHHTSNWDFPLGLLLRRAMKFNANFVMKANMFKGPFGTFFRWLGGHPVERDPSKKRGSLIYSISRLYAEKESLIITFTPEGTRSKVRKLKTGSWAIAKKANVPILFIDFNFATKTFRIDKAHKAPDSFEEEYKLMKAYFKNSSGLYPEKSFDFEDNDMEFS